MKLYEYLILDETEQWNKLWDLGTYLTHIEKDEHKYVLYGLGDFFVELKYNITDNKFTGKTTFKNGPILDKYLDLFDAPI